MRIDFSSRHIGPSSDDIDFMLKFLGFKTLDALTEKCTPASIRTSKSLDMGPGLSENEFLLRAWDVAKKNKVYKSYIGLGYYNTQTPTVIQRNILENPGWYTAYTPYQAEISQGRLEALLNFQTMIADLTGLPIANASLLDEATAAAEAINVAFGAQKKNIRKKVFVANDVFLQTLEVIQSRAEPLDIDVVIGDPLHFHFDDSFFAVLVQYPSATGTIHDYAELTKNIHNLGALVLVAADPLALTLLKPPGEWGADVVFGSTQRFGIPMGFGGPHAAYLATKEAYQRLIPGRIIGVSKDAHGNPALRLALQTREQHIRRENATSNICTAQVLLAVMASMYAVYHGPHGLKHIARQIHEFTVVLRRELKKLGLVISHADFFDTLLIDFKSHADREACLAHFEKHKINLGRWGDTFALISLDETTRLSDVVDIASTMSEFLEKPLRFSDQAEIPRLPKNLMRETDFLTHPVFNSHHSETEMLRYIHQLEVKDLALNHSMIPLGSCTMKLNATSEMIPITWPELCAIHPFVPLDQASGYLEIFNELEKWLCEVTGFSAVTFQPNAGSQGEYAGLLIIRKYLKSIEQTQRDICLIPSSAHGTNPASAVMAGFKVVVVKCDPAGNIDLEDLHAKVKMHEKSLAALMVTYPSTHGVFEATIKEICELVHSAGGQVYMDGANLNALVGIARPGEFGPDVMHINLHKTFCIPHGGGGPGMGPVGVAKHLSPFIPSHRQQPAAGPKTGISAVSAAPWGSASILPISWAYMAMMGGEGLKRATQVAILNANYIAKKLSKEYPVLYTGIGGLVAHECIIDTRPLKEKADVSVEDIAKRLMDYSFHAPTMSFPVPGTLMIEPTESESLAELDRFCDALLTIREEIREIEQGVADKSDNVLKNAPHSLSHVTSDTWEHKYSRQKAAFPRSWVKDRKFWTPVSRVDNVYGDRNLFCSCPPILSQNEITN